MAFKVVIAASFVLLVSVCGSFIAYASEYREKALPRTSFLGESLVGKSSDEVLKSVQSHNSELKERSLKVKVAEENFETKFSDVGWMISEEEVANEIFSYGHSGKKVTDYTSLVRAIFTEKKFEIKFTFNEKQAEDWLSLIEEKVGNPKTEANIIVKNGKALIVEPKAGRGMDEVAVKEEVYKRLSLQTDGDISIELIDEEPIVSKQEAQQLSDKAIELVAKPLEIQGPKSKITWSSNTIGTMITLVKEEEDRGFLDKPTYRDTYISFNKSKVSTELENQSENLNIDPIEARFVISDGQVSISTLSQSGEVVDIDKASDLIIEYLKEGKRSVVVLPSRVQEPSIKARESSDITKYGIKELIGTATTTFTGSSANRVHNVKTGVQAISGALIKPGEEFSTTGHLGQIDASTGYLQEMVIKEDKTVPEFGGGLCQVSTTLFRAAMNSGLKITERHNHSYRVSYYEPPIGMDATIYTPSPDLKFVNNTPSYILVQGRVEGYKATFDFYGTKDGREIEISEPYIYDQTPAPENVYIDDPSLAPGEEKRIDRAHPGAKSTFTYKVKKGDELIVDQKFNSSYVPWPAKYLRGPSKEENSEQAAQ